MRRLMRRALRLSAWLLAALVALGLSLYAHLELPIARSVAAVWLGDFVSDAVRGKLRIGRLEQLSTREVAARHVALWDGDGRRIVVGDRLVLAPDLGAFTERGVVRFASALLRRATVRLIDAGDGLPTLLTTFDAPPGTGTGGPSLHAIVDDITLEDITLYGDLLGLKGFRAVGLKARGRMEISEVVRVRIDSAKATLVDPFGFVGEVESLRGTISSQDTEGIALDADLRRGAERAHVRVRYAHPTPGAPAQLDLEVRAQDLSPDTLRSLGFDWIGPVATPLSGVLRMHGPLDALAVDGDLDTAAGKVRVTGEVGARGARITIASDALSVKQAFGNAPDVTTSGTVTIESSPGATAPRVHAELAPLVYGTIALPGFTLDGTLDAGGVTIERIQAKRHGGDIEGSGRVTSDGTIEMHVRARVPNIAKDPQLSALLPGTQGRLQADLQLTVPKAGRGVLRFSGSAALTNVRYGMLGARSLVVRGRMSGDPDLPGLDLRVSGIGVRLGEFELGDATLALAGAPGRYRASGQFEQRGQRTFQLDAEIAADRKGFVVNADPIELVLAEGSWRGALRDLEVIHGRSVSLGLLRLASRSQRLEAHGIVRVDGKDAVEVQLQDFDLAAVHALLGERFPLRQGRADTHLVMRGDLARPDVLLEGALRDGAYGGVDGVNALYSVSYRDGGLELDAEVDLGERGLARASGTGYLDLAMSDVREAVLRGTYRLDLSAEDLSLALLPALRDAGITGRLGGTLKLRGNPRTPDLSGSFVVAPFERPGWTPLSLRGQVGLANGLLDAHVTLLDDRGALAVFTGDVQVDAAALVDDPAAITPTLQRGPWRIRGQSARRLLSELPEPFTSDLPVTIATNLQLKHRDGSTTGLVRYRVEWVDDLRGTDCLASVHPSGQGFVRLFDERIEASFSAFVQGKSFATLKTTVGTSLDRWLAEGAAIDPESVELEVKLDIPEMERFPYLCEQGRGALHAEARMRGGAGSAPTFAARADASFVPQPMQVGRGQIIRVRSCEGDPVRAHVEATSAAGVARVQARMSGCHGGPTLVEATLPVTWRHGIVPVWNNAGVVKASVKFDGAQLRPLLRRTPGLHGGEATARGSVRVTGTPAKPRFAGQLDVRGGRVYLVSPGQELDEVAAHVTFHGNWAKLDRVTAKSGDGTLEASGGVGFDGWLPRRVQLALRAIDLPVQRESTELARFTGSAATETEIGRDRARSAVRIHELSVRLPDSVDRTLQPLDPHPDVTVTTEEAIAHVDPYPIEFAIDASRGMRVERNDLRVDLTAELAVSYADPGLRVGGYVELQRGQFEVLGKEFSIAQGGLRFDGTTDVNPEIRIIATHQPEIAGASPVTVAATGTLLQPEVVFTSEACPGESGAITYLISGQCSADDPELAQESAAAEESYKAGVVGAVGGAITNLLPRVGGFALAAESAGEGSTRVKAGFAADDALPKWMRSFVHRVYVQGAVTPGSTVDPATDAADPSASAGLVETFAPDILLELYFPYHLIGAGKITPGVSWGVDVTWEP